MTAFSTAFLHTGSRPVPRAAWRRRLALHLTVWKERRTLRRLSAHHLADLGLTPAQAEAEARRPIWDLPADRAFLHHSRQS